MCYLMKRLVLFWIFKNGFSQKKNTADEKYETNIWGLCNKN